MLMIFIHILYIEQNTRGLCLISFISLNINHLITTTRFTRTAGIYYIPISIGTVTSTAFRSTIMDPSIVLTSRCPTASTIFTISSHVAIHGVYSTVIVHGTVAKFCNRQVSWELKHKLKFSLYLLVTRLLNQLILKKSVIFKYLE